MSTAKRILEKLRETKAKRVSVPHISGAMRAHLAAELVLDGLVPVLVARDHEDAEALYRDLAFMLGTTDQEASEAGILFLGADEKSPYEEYSPDGRAVMERINTLYRLSRERDQVRAVVLTPQALVRLHVPPSLFDRAGDYIVAGEEIERDPLLRRLTDSGYNSVSTVEDPGTFSVRGGIIDIYSPHRIKPVRLDMFGDEIESIRLFDPTSQRTEGKIDDAILLPAREIVFAPEIIRKVAEEIEALADQTLAPTRRVNTILEDIENSIHYFGIESLLPLFHPEGLAACDAYLPTGDNVVFLMGTVDEATASCDEVWAEAKIGYERACATHQIALPPQRHLADADDVLERAQKSAASVEMPEIALSSDAVDQVPVRFQSTEGMRAEILSATRSQDHDEDILKPLIDRLKRWRSDKLTTLIVSHTRGQAERLKSLLDPRNVQVRLRTGPFSLKDFAPNKAKSVWRDQSVHAWLVLGEVSGGFVHPDGHIAIVSEEEIFGQRMKRRRSRAPAAGEFISDLKDLKPGDFVVHVDYGIGLYHGLTKLAVNGVESDYLNIEYKGRDKLYLPVHRLRLVSKYASATEGGRKPSLDRLGGQSWANTKRKVKDTLLKMAAELLRLYAVRASLEGFAFPAPDEAFRQFEAEFEFEPTVDQSKAINEVLEGLQQANPTDRLICGDVGYGKTEVAMRAAMLAVSAGKQVAVLVPTTVLGAQHHAVFSERFANYPVRVGIASRFQSRETIKKALKELKEGTLDIIIGTHRLLGKDVEFKDLGLLVVDEEHRFGVTHKEKLKKYRAVVHVVSMSATPIPRTLHMGFMGVRDLSVIATPPEDRLAVKTEVHKFSEDVIRDAILKEIRRGGQCFVVHNRVVSIGAFAKLLERLVPEARIAVAHGQMPEERLEKVMVEFMNREHNVLLCTTIIESGIDIPNANTIVINRADSMGLAQLYQLRGRVGRSKKRAFAHFLIPAGTLSKNARKRIAVLQRFSELGAGFKVASKDLEIRGAGNILGKQQSGTIAQVGFEMYQALLAEAIAELKGSTRKSLKEPEIQVPIPALIPDAYIAGPGERLSFYQRFNNADTDEVTYDLLQEIADLYGTPPAEVENLAQLMMLKQRLMGLGALGLDYGGQTKSMPPRIVIRFDAESPGISPEQLVSYVQAQQHRRKLTPEGKLVVHLAPFEDPREILQQSLEQLNELLRLRYGRAG